MEHVTYGAGKTIFEQGEAASHAYLIITRSVEIHREGFSALVHGGQLFGEAALQNRPRMAAAKAKTDCTLLAVSKEELIETIKTEPDEALDIIEAMFTRLADVIDQLNDSLNK